MGCYYLRHVRIHRCVHLEVYWVRLSCRIVAHWESNGRTIQHWFCSPLELTLLLPHIHCTQKQRVFWRYNCVSWNPKRDLRSSKPIYPDWQLAEHQVQFPRTLLQRAMGSLISALLGFPPCINLPSKCSELPADFHVLLLPLCTSKSFLGSSSLGTEVQPR
jgi:hypothetical protein